MGFSRRDAAKLHARLVWAMSMEEAKQTLGFKPTQYPSPDEIKRAWRTKSFENHPDRGGDPRKMVEINVAREILEGSRPAELSVTDPVQDARSRKYQTDVAKVRQAVESAEKVLRAAFDYAQHLLVPSWRRDLREYLTEDFSDSLDLLQEHVAQFQLGTDDSKQKQAIEKVEKLAEKVASDAVRVSSKYNGVCKRLKLGVETFTVQDLKKLYQDTEAFTKELGKLYQSSSQLVRYLRTTEGIPSTMDEVYDPVHDMILAYRGNFDAFSQDALKTAGSKLDKTVPEVLDILQEYGLGQSFDRQAERWTVQDLRLALHQIETEVSIP